MGRAAQRPRLVGRTWRAVHPGVDGGLRSTVWQDNERVAVEAFQGRYRVAALQGAVPC